MPTPICENARARAHTHTQGCTPHKTLYIYICYGSGTCKSDIIWNVKLLLFACLFYNKIIDMLGGSIIVISVLKRVVKRE